MTLIPTVVKKTRTGMRAYDIYSRLLEDRIVFVGGAIDNNLANSVIAQMLFLASNDPKKDIKLYINSPGGAVTSALAIYDTMQYIEAPISTVCVGMAFSAGAVLLAAGDKGKRFALPNSEMLLHQVAVSGGVTGPAVEIEIAAKHILELKNRINKILHQHTGQALKKIEQDTDRDFYLTSQEAKKYGLIDEVIKSKKA